MLIQTGLFSKASVTNQTLEWLLTIMYCNIIGEKLVTFLALSYSNCESHLAKTRAFFKNSNPGMTSCAKLTSAKWLSLYTLA